MIQRRHSESISAPYAMSRKNRFLRLANTLMRKLLLFFAWKSIKVKKYDETFKVKLKRITTITNTYEIHGPRQKREQKEMAVCSSAQT